MMCATDIVLRADVSKSGYTTSSCTAVCSKLNASCNRTRVWHKTTRCYVRFNLCVLTEPNLSQPSRYDRCENDFHQRANGVFLPSKI